MADEERRLVVVCYADACGEPQMIPVVFHDRGDDTYAPHDLACLLVRHLECGNKAPAIVFADGEGPAGLFGLMNWDEALVVRLPPPREASACRPPQKPR